MAEFTELRRELAEFMDRRGDWPADSAWLREAVEALPRHASAPGRLWQWDGQAYVPVERGVDEERWAALVYGSPDDAAVTQVSSGGTASSSLSCQAVVVDMLDSLDAEPGHRVLELGTGTGWNAALLAWRTGSAGQVTSVEVDPALSAEAGVRPAAAGTGTGARTEVHIRTGDGAAGWPDGAPYDRVISTYAVDRVPWRWVEQTRPGGRIVTPRGRSGHVALTVAEDGGSASGGLQGLAQFMPARGAAAAPDFAHVRGNNPAGAVHEGDFDRDPGPLHSDWHLRFALRVALPDVHVRTAVDEDGVNAWLHDGASSWAALSATAGDGTTVHQGGPRRLADPVASAWDRWLALRSPELYDFGMTVEPGRQYVWAWDAATGPRWPAGS